MSGSDPTAESPPGHDGRLGRALSKRSGSVWLIWSKSGWNWNSQRARNRFLEAARSPTIGGSPTWGVNGGAPGARSRKWLERADGTTEVLSSKVHDVPVAAGDLLHFSIWGGGGWGDPLARDPQLVGLEVRRGLVTAEGARRYGVVCDERGEVDAAATEELRASLRAQRADPLPTLIWARRWTPILARCQGETGLPAPRPPVGR
jgi:Hydantoinase B/oxoprolinase